MTDTLTPERVREMRAEVLRLRERLILIGIPLHGYYTGGNEAEAALEAAAHKCVDAAEQLMRLEEHLRTI